MSNPHTNTDTPTFVDAHCHIHDRDTYQFALSRQQISRKTLRLQPDLPHQPSDFTPEKLLSRAKAAHVDRIVCIGTSHQDSLLAQAFSGRPSDVQIFWAYGIHPDEAERPQPETIDFSIDHPPIAIGEIGLDYRNGTGNRQAQIALLERMLQLALNHNLPCIFHVRDAFDDFWPIIDNFHIKHAVAHSFSDSLKNLDQTLMRDFMVGINGLATFADLDCYKDYLPPLDRILLETDAPFLAPTPVRGRVCEPSYIPKIAGYVANRTKTPLLDVAKITSDNTERFFKFKS